MCMSTHLYTRSCYSLLNSTIRIQEYVKYASSLGYESIVLTDHNVMYGSACFIRACQKEGIHGIVGMEVDCMYHDTVVPFLLLSKDNKGYVDLMHLSSYLNEKSSTCSLQQLQQVTAHCHLIVFGEGGWLDHALTQKQTEEIKNKLLILKQDFQDFDIALSYNDSLFWKERNILLKRIAQTLQIPTVALHKIYYLKKEDTKAFQILRCMSENKTIDDASVPEIKGRYYLSQVEMQQLYDADDLQRSDEIASLCHADYQLEKTSLPTYSIKEDVEPKVYLTELCKAGLKKRLHGKNDEQYMQRLMYELSVIIRMHFENYFLIVYDFICHARKNGIYIGPGRGSAAGSLVAYCLGITMIDPLQYGLLFERFLNPERISMPDIDVDIPDKDRSKVIEYVYQKYGEDHVCNIVTYGTLAAKMVIREVAKVLNLYSREIDAIIKCIPNKPKMTLQKAYETSPRFKQLIQSKDKYLQLFEISKKLEGLPHHTSVHAGGILLSKDTINDIVPTTREDTQLKTSQYSMEYLEERGLIKIDLLGLRNLSIIDEIVKKIQVREPQFQILNISMHDTKTYEVFSSANTLGIFQFESEGMRNLLRRLQPKNIQEVADAMALYRPGPMDHINTYLQNKQDPSSIQYASKDVYEVLKETYGVMIYQDQIMLIARNVAGFSLGKADILRKAISKKKQEELINLKQDFIIGAMQHEYTKETANQLYDDIEKFADYGYNKSHAIAYSYIAYQLAYLKANYPLDFYSSLLNSVISDTTKTSRYVYECKRRHIMILYPSVNDSLSVYKVEKSALRIPLAMIHEIGTLVSDHIVNEREQNGKYIDFFDFVARCNLYNIHEEQIKTLINAGACDCFLETRATLTSIVEKAFSYADVVKVFKNGKYTVDASLVSKPSYIKLAENEYIREENERNALGYTLGSSYISKIREENQIAAPSLAQLSMMQGKVIGFAQIRDVRKHRTKKGSMMAFLKLSDETGEMDMMVMPIQYEQYCSSLVKGVFILFHARMQEDRSMICDTIQFYKK